MVVVSSGVAVISDGNPAPHGRIGLMEHRYRTYWTHTPEGLFIVEVMPSGEFRLEGLNPAHERRTGLLTENVAGRALHECLPPDVAEAISRRYQSCVDAGRPISYEEVLDLPGGRRHWETSLAPVRDASGRIAWLLGGARDITERVGLEAALAESEAKFRLMAETVPDIIFSAPSNGVADYRNRRYYDYTGIAPGSEPGPLGELHPTDRAKLKRQWPKTRKTGRLTAEVRIRGADQGYRWFMLRATRLDTPLGRRWFGVATDIHEVRTAADAHQRLNDRLESVLAAISDCYYTIGRDWRITSVNPQAAEWFGRPPEALIGADARDALKYPPGMIAQVGAVLRAGLAAHGEHVSAYRPGCVVDVHVYPSAEGASVFFRDVTLQHGARREVEHARALLQGTVDALTAHVAILDPRGVVIAVNRAWCDMIAERAPDLPDSGLGAEYVAISGAARGREGEAVARGIKAVVQGKRAGFAYTYRFGDPERWFQVVLRRFDHAGEARTVVAHEDITDATLAQRSLREAAEHLLDLQEEERRRIAVELHDSSGQNLVALGLAVSRLKALSPPSPETAALFRDIRESLDEAQRELRVFSYLLHPPYLDKGLAESLRKFLRGFALRSNLEVVDRIDPDIDAAKMALRRAAFRIVQEALSNVHRHADATRVKVELGIDGERLKLRVADNGKGLPKVGEAPQGVGIAGMRARVSQLGGKIRISSRGRGVTIEVSIPLGPA